MKRSLFIPRIAAIAIIAALHMSSLASEFKDCADAMVKQISNVEQILEDCGNGIGTIEICLTAVENKKAIMANWTVYMSTNPKEECPFLPVCRTDGDFVDNACNP